MANLKSSQKQARKNIKQRAVNLARKTSVKTAIKKVLDAVNEKNVTLIKELLKDAESKLARSGSKGTVHRKNASRKISRLAKRVAQLVRGA